MHEYIQLSDDDDMVKIDIIHSKNARREKNTQNMENAREAMSVSYLSSQGDDEDEYTVMQVAKILIHKMKGEEASLEDWITYVDDRPFNDKRYYISNEKIKSLGWRKEMDFERGISELVGL
jgi:dTDP-glucose 4,6-dehydratase/UDP-glucose 4,6-dehydratase